MPRPTERRAFLNPDVIHQLKTLFGTGKNVHDRLALHEVVPRHAVQQALSGWPITIAYERVLRARWVEWRQKFLADPQASELTAERVARLAGEFHDPDARDPVSEKLMVSLDRFTLLPDASKHL